MLLHPGFERIVVLLHLVHRLPGDDDGLGVTVNGLFNGVQAFMSGKVKVHLSAAGRKLVRKHKRATVFANVTVGGTRVASVSIQLMR